MPDSNQGWVQLAGTWLDLGFKACIDATPKAGPEQNGFDILASGGGIMSTEAY